MKIVKLISSSLCGVDLNHQGDWGVVCQRKQTDGGGRGRPTTLAPGDPDKRSRSRYRHGNGCRAIDVHARQPQATGDARRLLEQPMSFVLTLRLFLPFEFRNSLRAIPGLAVRPGLAGTVPVLQACDGVPPGCLVVPVTFDFVYYLGECFSFFARSAESAKKWYVKTKCALCHDRLMNETETAYFKSKEIKRERMHYFTSDFRTNTNLGQDCSAVIHPSSSHTRRCLATYITKTIVTAPLNLAKKTKSFEEVGLPLEDYEFNTKLSSKPKIDCMTMLQCDRLVLVCKALQGLVWASKINPRRRPLEMLLVCPSTDLTAFDTAPAIFRP
ncbi:hypothetical protein J6590_036234 [Homalodisca vitripennis]|nr:hypothetical protein J6590_036234 [Homalodisca vitripennis]